MLGWLRKLKETIAKTSSGGPALGDARSARVGQEERRLTKYLLAKGYQGPFAGVCDGIDIVIFHAHGVTPLPSWLSEADNPFSMPVMDCRSICGQSLFYAFGDRATGLMALLDIGGDTDEAELRARLTTEPVTTRVALGYPRVAGDRPADGPLVIAKQMEDLWNIYLFGNSLYFTRSWTGEVRHRAHVSFFNRAMFITAIETFAAAVPEDDTFAVRQVDYLVKAALCGMQTPAPIPARISPDPHPIAQFTLTEYGHLAGFASLGETMQHRLGLNGLLTTAPPNPHNGRILSALAVLQNEESPSTRAQLLETLRERDVSFAFTRIGPEIAAGGNTDDNTCSFTQTAWNDEACFFVYTDPSYCVEPSHLHASFAGKRLAAFVRQLNKDAVLVLNPGGPVTAVLRMAELEAIASEA
jgi:hypothetical protein